MRALVEETTQTFSLPANVDQIQSVILRQHPVRPRLEGYENALRGPALSAQLADRAELVFMIRPQAATAAAAQAALNNLQAFISIQPSPLLGGDVDDAGNTSFPYLETDVSGDLMLFRGRLAYDVQDWGVCSATLRLLNWGAAPLLVLVTTQIFADVRVPQWERERNDEELA